MHADGYIIVVLSIWLEMSWAIIAPHVVDGDTIIDAKLTFGEI